jgi:hypothetical protein
MPLIYIPMEECYRCLSECRTCFLKENDYLGLSDPEATQCAVVAVSLHRIC